MPNRFRRRHLLQTGRHLTEKSRMLTLPGLPVNPAHPGSRLLARRIRAGATGSPDAKNHPAAKRRRVSTNKNKTAARNHREKHSQNISHPKNRIKRSGAMHFRMAPLVFRVSGPRSKDGGRKQSLPAPVRKTAAGNSHWRPPFERRRPGTVIAGPRSKDGGRKQSLAAPRSKDRGRKQSLPAPVQKTEAGNNHCRP